MRTRLLALATTGAAALLLGAGLGALHPAAPAVAAQPLVGAIGCASGTNNAATITWATQGNGSALPGVISSSQTPVYVAPATAGSLSLAAPTTNVLCAVILQDSDGTPNTVDGGSFTANVNAPAQITESNTTNYSWNCGTPTPAAPNDSCASATLITAPAPLPATTGGVVGGVQGNSFHVQLNAGSTFGVVGTATPAINVSVTWNPYSSLVPPDTAFTVGSFTIPIVAPVYVLSLSANPATIPANLPTSTNVQGSVITAVLFHVNGSTACVTIVPASTGAPIPTYACNLAPTALAALTAGAAGTPFVLFPGAESGTVRLQTNLGVFSAAGPTPAGPVLTAVTGAAQIVSVHCGALPNTFPTTLIPTPGLLTTLTLNSCQSVSATLVGGGEAGTATIVGTFVGDFTGAQAATPGETTVNLTPGPITVALTTGCNEVLTPVNLAGGSTGQQVAALASGFNVTSIWVFNNATHTFQALYFPGNAPTDISSVGPNQSVFVCGTGAGTFRVA